MAGRARLARYALYQGRDFAVQRGVPILIVGALLLLLSVEGARAWRGAGGAGGAAELARASLAALLDVFAPTATLLAVNGIVSNDRRRRFYRLLFAKPVSLSRYYVQAWLVSAAGTLVCAVLLLGAFALVVQPVFPPGALLFVALYFLLFGGLGFLLSAVTRHDWLALGLVWAMARLLRSLLPADASWYGRAIDLLLPPLHVLEALGGPLVHGEPVPGAGCAWIVAYGVASLALGSIIVRRRPLAS